MMTRKQEGNMVEELNLQPFAEPTWLSSSAPPYHTNSHHTLRRQVRSFLEAEIFPHVQKWEQEGYVPDEAYRKMADAGLVLPSLPAKYRNGRPLPAGIPDDEWDLFHTMLLNQEISRAPANGPMWGLNSGNTIGCPPILHFGSETQREAYLPRVHRGEIRFCLAVTEPGAGSDVSGITTSALPDPSDPDYFLVNGRKKWITNGMWADYATTLVRTSGPTAPRPEYSLLIIPLRSTSSSSSSTPPPGPNPRALVPGLTMRKISTSGLNGSGAALLVFHDVRVPRSNLIGAQGSGFAMVMANFNPERLALAGSALVLARTCLSEAMAHAGRRKTFGRALIENQIIRAKLAGMVRSLESTHAWFERVVWEVEQKAARSGKGDTKDYAAAFADPELGARVALVKVQAGKTLELLSREAQQIFGGAGATREGPGAVVEQISRDMRVWVVGGGSEEILDDLGMRLALMRNSRPRHEERINPKL